MSLSLLHRFELRHPIFQAPMAGGGDTPELAAAVAEAGALGFFGAAYLAPQQITAFARAVRQRTKRPFGINLFAPLPLAALPSDTGAALERLSPYFGELGLPPPGPVGPPEDTFQAQVSAALESGAAAFSFTCGLPPRAVADAIRARGMAFLATATTVEEAVAIEKAGADAVVAQGSEAGGHRGSFLSTFEEGLVGTVALVPQMVDAVRIPVIASGGIMDGRGIAAALALGASAVQLGTAFLTCDEAGVPEAYQAAILGARETQTRITRAFSGRPARGIVNRFMREVESGGGADAILPFPFQNVVTRPLRSAAARQGRAEFLSLWAGQGLTLARRQSAAALVERLAAETDAAIRRLAGGLRPQQERSTGSSDGLPPRVS
jgi:nitronate monooxygenase